MIPGWLKDFAKGVLRPKEYFPPRCIIDKSPMHKIGSLSDGTPMYECGLNSSHTYAPGVNIGDRNKMIEKNSGDRHGEI